MRKRYWGFWASALLFCLALLRSSVCRAGIREGMVLCATALIPALFPFSVLSSLWIRTGFPAFSSTHLGGLTARLFTLPGQAAVPLCAGALGGYPLGPRTLASLYTNGMLTREQALRLSAFSNNPGPAFLLGVVGSGILQSPMLGLLSFLLILLSAGLTGILLADPRGMHIQRMPVRETPQAFFPALLSATAEAASGMLRLCSIVIFFSGIRSVLFAFLSFWMLPVWLEGFLSGALELSAGIYELASVSMPIRFLLCTMLTCWGGFCVHMQAAEALVGAGLPMGLYIKGKLMQTAICGLWTLVCLPWLFPGTCPARKQLIFLSLIVSFFLLFGIIFKKYHWNRKQSVL